jgi:23S rRNA (adenine2503-C2)-methyltransferase
MVKIRLCGQNLIEMEDWIVQLGEPRYRAHQIYQWIYQRGANDFAQMTDLPKHLRALLQETAQVGLPTVIKQQLDPEDLTVKLLLELKDKQSVEAVLMPYSNLDFSRDRLTGCISSQVGCPIGCPFCATGQGGFIRNLEAGEIVGQVIALRQEALKSENTLIEGLNIVFMGMGEPLLNYAEVLKSIYLLHDPKGLNISLRRITLSTAGVVPRIYQLAQEELPINLAVSLHAPNNDLRNQLVPLNRRYPLEELIPACRKYFESSKRRVTFEYILLNQVNDTEDLAEELALRLKGLPALVNLIPANPTNGADQRPSPERIRSFIRILKIRGLEVTLREGRGGNIAAACGQLRAKDTSLRSE